MQARRRRRRVGSDGIGDPEPLARERIGRQSDMARRLAGEQRRPVQVVARAVARGQMRQQRASAGLLRGRPLREQRGAVLVGVGLQRVRKSVGVGERRLQRVDQRRHAVDHPCLAHREMFAADQQGACDIGQRRAIDVAAQPVAQRGHAPAQRVRRLRGQRDQCRRGRGLARARRGGARRFFQHDMRVGAAEAERADARTQRRGFVAARPRPAFAQCIERRAVDGDARVDPGEIVERRQRAMAERQQHLDHTGDTGGGFEVTDVGLDRTEPAEGGAERRALALRKRVERLGQALEFDGVALRRPGAVQFDKAQRGDRYAGAFVRRDDDLGLRACAGIGECVGLAAVVHGAALDDAVDRIAVGDRALQRLQQQECRAFAAHVAVGGVVERLARAGGREHPHLRERDVTRRREQQIDAAGQRKLAVPVFQRLDRAVDRVQRTGARCVDRDAGAAEIEEMRYPIRHDGGRGTGGVVRLDRGRTALLQFLVIVIEDTDDDADVLAAQAGRRDASVLHARPRELQHDPLLRIHALHDFR